MVYDWLMNRLFPPLCALCGQPGTQGLDLCAGCLARLPRPGPRCPRCALPLAGEPPPGTLCGRCQRRPPRFDHTLAALLYRPPADRLILELKFSGCLANARLLGSLLAAGARRRPRPDLIVPVPLHPARQRQRGFNQALEIARTVARETGVPLAARLAERTRPTDAQSGLSAGDRRRNLRGAFRATGRVPQRIALLDDVMTTGSTLDELAAELKRHGAERVEAWVCARTPGPD